MSQDPTPTRADPAVTSEPTGSRSMISGIATPSGRVAAPRAGGHAMTVRDLNAYYGETHAVKGVSLDYAANGVTAMIGPSGCG